MNRKPRTLDTSNQHDQRPWLVAFVGVDGAVYSPAPGSRESLALPRLTHDACTNGLSLLFYALEDLRGPNVQIQCVNHRTPSVSTCRAMLTRGDPRNRARGVSHPSLTGFVSCSDTKCRPVPATARSFLAELGTWWPSLSLPSCALRWWRARARISPRSRRSGRRTRGARLRRILANVQDAVVHEAADILVKRSKHDRAPIFAGSVRWPHRLHPAGYSRAFWGNRERSPRRSPQLQRRHAECPQHRLVRPGK